MRSYCFVDVILDFPQEKSEVVLSVTENKVQEIIVVKDENKYLKGDRKTTIML